MKRSMLLVGLASFALYLAVPRPAKAQGLSNVDRSLLFYYTWQTNRQADRILRDQQRMNRQFNQFEQRTIRELNRPNPLEEYVRQGRVTSYKDQQLPPIYAGRRNFFMRTDAFNPQQRRY